jgi:hypothetical protein
LRGRSHPEITYRSETLAEPNNIRARQAAGTADVHPNGRFVYGLYILRMELPDFVKRLSRIEMAGAKAEFVQALKEAKEQAEALETPEVTSALLGQQSGRTSLAASHRGDSPTVGSRLPRVARGH